MTETATRPSDVESPDVVPTRRTSGGAARIASLMFYRVAFLVVAVSAWWLLSVTTLSDVLPAVSDTFTAIRELLTSSEFYDQMLLTVRRVLGGFAIAYVSAFVIGTAMGRSRRCEAFFELLIVAGLSQPGIFIAMIILIALGLRESSAIIAMGYLAMPMVAVNFWQGTKRLDPELEEMSQVFGYSWWSRMRHVILPQLATPAITAARHGFGISWKYVVVIELLGLPDGVGYQVNRAFQLYDLTMVIAWTIGFMIFVSLFEYLALRPLERFIFRWRDAPMGKAVTGQTSGVDHD